MSSQTSIAKSTWQPALSCALALVACLTMHPALAQTPTIEELEKRIEEAKRAKEAKDQAQARQAAEQPSAAPAAKQGTLGKDSQLRQDIVAVEAQRRERAAGPFDEFADGLLRDHRSGLIWSASDNGKDVDWVDASRYCTRRGMQLPTVAQLQRLVDRTGAMATPCQGRQCKVSDRFHLTGYGYWSRQREGARWAVFVTLDSGRRSFDYVGIRNNYRALCVRGTDDVGTR